MLTDSFYVDSFMKGEERDNEHLQSIVEVLGPMPVNLLSDWQSRHKIIDESGSLLPGLDEFKDSLRDQILKYKPSTMSQDDALAFEDLMRLMFRYQADERASAEELLQHPWINKTYN